APLALPDVQRRRRLRRQPRVLMFEPGVVPLQLDAVVETAAVRPLARDRLVATGHGLARGQRTERIPAEAGVLQGGIQLETAEPVVLPAVPQQGGNLRTDDACRVVHVVALQPEGLVISRVAACLR